MHIGINKEQVEINNVLSGEKVGVRIDDIITLKNGQMRVIMSHIVVRSAVERPNLKQNNNILGIPKSFDFETEKHYSTVAIQLVKDKLIELGIAESEMSIASKLVWEHEEQIIRVTIPKDEAIDNDNYTQLISYVRANNIVYEKDVDNYYLYLTTLDQIHRDLFEADETVLIENKPA